MNPRLSPGFLRLVVASLKAEVESAYHMCDDAAACAAHDNLVAAEWRLRQAERRRR